MENTRPVQKLLMFSTMLFFVGLFLFSCVPKAHAATMFNIDPIYKVLTPDTNIYTDPKTFGFAPGSYGYVVAYIWDIMMKLVNSLVLVALIYVAFMNILRVQMDSYAVKKILPTFIMAVILVNFSFLISRIVIDIGNVAISIFLLGDTNYKITSAFDGLIATPPKDPDSFTPVAGSTYAGYIVAYTFKQLLIMVGSVLVFILSFIFMIRNYMIYFLVAIAPIGFMAMVLPVTKKYFQMWWSNFSKWVFMPVISVFWLWLAGQFMTVVGSPGNEGGAWFLPLGFAGLCFYMAITSPFKIGGAVMGAWAGWGKKAWGKTGGQVTGAAKAGFTQRYDRTKMRLVNRAMATPLGKRYEKYKAKQVFLTQQPQDVRAKAQEDAQKAIYLQAYHGHVTGKKKMGDAEYSRVIARSRKWIGEEQETVRHHPAEGMYQELKNMKAIDEDTGYLKDEKELSKLKPDDYLKIKAIVKELREQQRRPITRTEADLVWWKTIKPGKIRTAQVQDIARDLYDEKLDFPDPEIPSNVATARGRTPEATPSVVQAAQPLTRDQENARNARRLQEQFGTAPAAGAPGGAGPGGAYSSAVPGEGYHSIVDEIHAGLGDSAHGLDKDSLAAAIASAIQKVPRDAKGVVTPDNVSAALLRIPELRVRISGAEPEFWTRMNLNAARIANKQLATETRLHQQTDRALENLANLEENNLGPNEAEPLITGGRKELESFKSYHE